MKIGDKIRVVAHMTDDPAPPPVGTGGTIVDIIKTNWEGVEARVVVQWPKGMMAVSTLLIPHDSYVFEVVDG